MTSPGPLLLTVDGNSLLHRAFHSGDSRLVDDAGRPMWAIHGLVLYVGRVAARLRPDAVVVGFDCPDSSFRKSDYPDYKAQRPPKSAQLQEQLDAAPALLAAAGFTVAVPTSCEADDVLASSAARARDAGWRCVVVTSDRDAYALVGPTTSVFSVRNGGVEAGIILTAETVQQDYGVPAQRYRDYAALRGDTSDNLAGVTGIGGKTAAKLLSAYGSVQGVYAALDAGDADAVSALAGSRVAQQLATTTARALVERNLQLMSMRTDVPLPDLDDMRLPLDPQRVRSALRTRGITLGPSLWALTGGVPPPPPEPPVEPAATVTQRAATAASWRRTKREARLPGEDQLALF